MSLWSQVFTVVGLFFEFLSVAYTARKVLRPRTGKERKKKYIEELVKYPTVEKKLESKANEWYIVLGFLSVGIIFQAIAVFV